MFSLNIILTILLLAGIGYVTYLIKKNRALAVINNLISHELGVLVEAATKVAKNLPGRRRLPSTPGELLEDPALLATILTAMVIKYGNMKLGMTDFDSISNEDYISVYIDTSSNELLLSINPDLDSGTNTAGIFGSYPKPDDGTFH